RREQARGEVGDAARRARYDIADGTRRIRLGRGGRAGECDDQDESRAHQSGLMFAARITSPQRRFSSRMKAAASVGELPMIPASIFRSSMERCWLPPLPALP